MNRFARALAVAVLPLIAGCTYRTVPAVPPPDASLTTAPARPIAGTWLVHVEAERLTREAALTGFGCRAASYPVDATGAFTEAVHAALERAFDRVEAGDLDTTTAGLRRARASGIVIVQPAQFEPRADIEQRGFGATVRASTTLAANVTVDREFRRVFQGTVEASGAAAVPIGMMFDCGAVREAINQATGRAVQELAQRIAGRLAAAPGIRPVPVARRGPAAVPAARRPDAEPAPPAAPPATPVAPAPQPPATTTPTS